MASRNTAIVNASLPILFLGASAAIQMIASCMYLKCILDFSLIFQAFLITGGVYLLNRILDKEDKFNNLPRWMFFNKTLPRTMFWFLLAGSAIFGPVLLNVVSNRINVAIWFGVLSVIGIFYSVKLIPILMYKKGLQWISIKDIPIVKSFVVCITWGGSGLILASAVTNVSVFRPDVLIIILTFVICNLNSTVTSDARDITGDKLRKIYTIPVLFGEKGTLIFLILVNVLAIVVLAASGFSGLIPGNLSIFAALSVLWAGVSILPQFITKIKLSKTVMELLVDSHLMITAVGLVILSVMQ
ncbi:MAG: UbiA family prenyltransferase [Fibrobacter sp.]|nr:UbiA family prenyltransferase [Fibrobacter sp.]